MKHIISLGTLLFSIGALLTTCSGATIVPDTVQSYLDVSYAGGINDNAEKLDIYTDKRWNISEKKPVIFYVHGGGWAIGDKANVSYKPEAFVAGGYVFVSINYTLYNQDTGANQHPAQILDVAKAFKYIYDNIDTYGGDKSQIYVLGHSAGAHLVALLATDGSYLAKYGLCLGNISGTLLLDGAGYDIPTVLSYRATRGSGDPSSEEMYEQVFGTDVEDQKQASPIYHVSGGKGINPFLFLTAGSSRRASSNQAQLFSDALDPIGVYHETYNFPNETHESLNKGLGASGDDKIPKIFAFIKKIRDTSFIHAGCAPSTSNASSGGTTTGGALSQGSTTGSTFPGNTPLTQGSANGVVSVTTELQRYTPFEAAEILAGMGIIGKQASEIGYRLMSSITRAEIAKVAVQVAGLKQDVCEPSETRIFPDVSASLGDLCGYVEAAAKAGMIRNGNRIFFRPNTPTTRAEATKVLMAAAGRQTSATPSTYTDVGYWLGDLAGYINGLHEIGCADVADGGKFLPGSTASRGQTFVMVVCLFGKSTNN